jgi:PAS domain S-box-containing protein
LEAAFHGLVIGNTSSGAVLDLNPAALLLFGCSRPEAHSLTFAELLSQGAPHMREEAEARFTHALTNGSKTFEWRARRQGGQQIWLEVTVRPAELAGAHRFMAELQDISDRKQMEETLLAVSRAIASATGSRFFPELVRHLVSALDVDAAFVGEFLDNDSTVARTLAHFSNGSPHEETDFDLSHAPCRQDGTWVPCCHPEGVRVSHSLDPLISESAAEGYAAVPLRDSADRILGILLVYSRRPLGNPSRIDLFLQTFALRAAAELERKRAEERLQRERMFSDIIINSFPGGFYLVGGDGRLLRWNKTTERVTGYSAAEIRQKVALDFFDPSCRDAVRTAFSRVFREGEATVEAEVLTKQGVHIPVLAIGTRFFLGRTPCILGLALDISSHKRTEEALKQSEERYRALVDSINEVIFSLDAAGVITFITSPAERILGYPPAEVIGRNFAEFIYPDDLTRIQEQFRRLSLGERHPDEYRVVTREGYPHWVLSSSQPHFKNGVFIGITGLLTDIHQRKETEAALEQSEERYKSLFEAASDAILILRDDIIVDCNACALAMFAGSREQILGHHPYELSPAVQPGGKNSVELGLQTNTAAVRGATQLFSWQHTRVDGTPFDAEVSLNPVMLSTGVHVLAIVRDVTARKCAETELQQSELKFRNIIESIPVGMHMYHLQPDGRLVFIGANPAADRMLGVNNSEFIGKTIEEAFPPLAETEIPARYRDVALGRGPWATDQISYSDGRITGGFEVHAFQVSPQKMVAAFVDVTQRRLAEEQIRSSLQEKEVLLKEIHHRVKNNLQIISSLFALEAQTIEDPPILEVLRDMHNRVRSMALVHQILYQSEDFAAIDLGGYIRRLLTSLFRSYAIDPSVITLRIDVADVLLPIDTAIPCGLIMNELVTNALKHGFSAHHQCHLTVTLAPNEDGHIALSVANDGNLLPEGFDSGSSTGLGLQLVRTLTEQLEGSLTIERTPCTKFSVTFKK